ncbi:imm11 family protein [Sandaracinobacteroides hominis]|uniref:imm11 family protein n=1 Tax=Sandaracinobacteroides hominis TaxID=2780086 RepID=UPI0018F7B804|nr:DUF1629 domain-containing protein [Sandaracinobacteroides hominis]
MSSDHVWMTNFLSDGRTTVGFQDDLRERDMTRGIEFGTTAGRGQAWPADDFPKTMWARVDDGWSDKRLAKERDVITGPSVPLVSAAVAEALSGIDIGPSKFVPTDVFFSDRKRRTEKRYFQFHITPQLRTVAPEASRKIVHDKMHDSYRVSDQKADDLAVSRAAAGGLKMWTAGDMVMNHFFCDEVVRALKKAKLDRPFQLTRCRLV